MWLKCDLSVTFVWKPIHPFPLQNNPTCFNMTRTCNDVKVWFIWLHDVKVWFIWLPDVKELWPFLLYSCQTIALHRETINWFLCEKDTLMLRSLFLLWYTALRAPFVQKSRHWFGSEDNGLISYVEGTYWTLKCNN